jgi:antitoxin component YwqK of YwqJK toxin-antitoxin module
MNFDPATCKDMHTTQYYRTGKVKWERAGQNGTYTVTTYDSLLGYKKSIQERVDDPRNPNGDLLLHGKSTEFASDGSIIEEITYEYGQANGEVKTTDSDGTVVLQGMMSRGAKVGEWLYYLKSDGSKTNKVKDAAFFRKINYKSGNAPFLYTDYYPTGEKMAVSYLLEEWPDKNVNFINRFYKNGQKMEEGTFGYSKMSNNYEGKTGEWKTYYENGQLKSKGSYRVNDPVGTWEFYDEKGNLTETKNYR